ncbi:12788_t:CDS:2, partial [Racocetra persica]
FLSHLGGSSPDFVIHSFSIIEDLAYIIIRDFLSGFSNSSNCLPDLLVPKILPSYVLEDELEPRVTLWGSHNHWPKS